MKLHRQTRNYINFTNSKGEDLELELRFADDTLAHLDPLIYERPNGEIVVGYLSQDSDCANPLEDSDGMGHIYTSRRHDRESNENMQDALGLDREWRPNLDDIAEEDAFIRGASALLVEGDEDILTFLREQLEDPDKDSFNDEELGRAWYHAPYTSWLAEKVEAMQLEMWKEARAKGEIGNKYAVSLDVYEHGGIAFSVSGHGMQCQFDTARGGAVWVPDKYAEEEIESRVPIFRKGDINKVQVRGRTFYNVRTFQEGGLRFDDTPHGEFSDWHTAYLYLKSLDVPEPRWRPLDATERAVAQDLAEQACEVYTTWCNGECYGVCIAVFDADGTERDDRAEECWGFIGGDYAQEELQRTFDANKED